jgi:hypothetical protein
VALNDIDRLPLGKLRHYTYLRACADDLPAEGSSVALSSTTVLEPLVLSAFYGTASFAQVTLGCDMAIPSQLRFRITGNIDGKLGTKLGCALHAHG